jgi:hypothetical protein
VLAHLIVNLFVNVQRTIGAAKDEGTAFSIARMYPSDGADGSMKEVLDLLHFLSRGDIPYDEQSVIG